MKDVSCSRVGFLIVIGPPATSLERVGPTLQAMVNDGCKSSQMAPGGFSLSLEIVPTAAGECMFLLLPGLLRMMAFVRQLLRRDSKPKRVGGGSVGRKQLANHYPKHSFLYKYRGALLISSELSWPNCRIRINRKNDVGGAAVLIQLLN